MWPYRLGDAQLAAYLQAVAQIHEAARYRARGGWSERIAERLRTTLDLPVEWSVLPLRSGTDALVMALQAAGVEAGEEVGVPDLAFEAVAASVLRVGARPVWLDVDEQTWNLTPETLTARRPLPRVVIGVDNFGAPCDWQGIGRVCREHGTTFILDRCESLGARYPHGPASDHADFVAHSFSFSKPIHAAGAGGALCAPSTTVDRIKSDPRYSSWPTRLPEVNAAFLFHAWPDLERSVDHLNRVYEAYSKLLTDLGAVQQKLIDGASSAWIFAPFRLPPDRWHASVPCLIELIAKDGITSRRAFTPQRTLFGANPGLPRSTRLFGEILCLPTGASMPLNLVDTVVERLYAAEQALRTA